MCLARFVLIVGQGLNMALKVDDLVEVRSKEDILASLDTNGRLDELPFMPQMFQYCGKRFRVLKRAHKTCDTVNPIAGRRVSKAVHLDLRCDGKAYAGCQAGCLIFWKEAWLKPVGKEEGRAARSIPSLDRHETAEKKTWCKEEDVWTATCAHDAQATDGKRYFCQATQLPYYTTTLPWWDITQYVEDYSSGNVSLPRLLSGFVYICYYHLALAKRNRLGRPARWLYDRFQAAWGGIPFPRRTGIIPAGQLTPTTSLNLEPGELVRVRSYQEILSTLDTNGFNRGMCFDAEMVPYCGGVYRVQAKVERFVNEKTGRTTTLKTPAVILEGVWCRSRYSNCRMFCPRSIYSWWREIWLARPAESASR
jgi:hypothetical protein